MKFLDTAKSISNPVQADTVPRVPASIEYAAMRDGGKGGDVWAEAVDNLNTLIDYRYQQHVAPATAKAARQDMSGAGGDDALLRTPARKSSRDARR